jgi:D-alanyl-lipoteichoic acid acyltransferase DltB (MBOAT superfamily)
MLFNSYEFALYFLPVTVLVFFAIGRWSRMGACAWLGLASLAFYGYWSPRYIPLLLGSIVVNYVLGGVVARHAGQARGRAWLAVAVSANLLLLGYYKYANFFLANVAEVTHARIAPLHVLLPIGISFFTFTQIAYLVDAYKAKVVDRDPLRYLLFVTYFPHLIAGPILHHAEMMPQFARRITYRFRLQWLLPGLVMFMIGLAKKVVLADGIQPYVPPVFDHAAAIGPTAVQAWGAALAYAMQLYFDFSGYSDMAVGLALMMNIRLPFNFDSPYKAANISDFWRRWHMTLSRFLRDYLYVPLGGNRKGRPRRYFNLMVTMLLGGLWHGASWTFVLWGGLHGLYLCVHHAWSAARKALGWTRSFGVGGDIVARALTFVAVTVAWVFFRASSPSVAVSVLRGMAGLNGSGLPGEAPGSSSPLAFLGRLQDGLQDSRQLAWILALCAIAFLLPNSQTIVQRPPPGTRLAPRRSFALSGSAGFCLTLVMLLLVINASRGASEFIYFNF